MTAPRWDAHERIDQMTTSAPPPPTFGQWLDQQAGQASDLGKVADVWKASAGSRKRVSSVQGVTDWLVSAAADAEIDPAGVRATLQAAGAQYRAWRTTSAASQPDASPAAQPSASRQIAEQRGWIQPELPAEPPPEAVQGARDAFASVPLPGSDLDAQFGELRKRLAVTEGKLDEALGWLAHLGRGVGEILAWQGEQDERLEPLRRLMAELGETEDAADAIDGVAPLSGQLGAGEPAQPGGLWAAFRMPEPDHGALAERAADDGS